MHEHRWSDSERAGSRRRDQEGDDGQRQIQCCIGGIGILLPWLIGFTVVLVAAAFFDAYRPVRDEACTDGTCTRESKRPLKIVAWIVPAVAAIPIAFPYYIE